ncbi:dihydrofolate reductase [Candidatus Woesebacteria bacterium]|nr:dihydrofolate reductase [Candidatus Woesebacteria bacterium]
MISLIAAVSENNVVGSKGKIPWYLPADFAYFKKITTGHHVVMGQTTYNSIGKPLPERKNIVLTYNKDLLIEGCVVKNSIEDAIEHANKNKEKELFIIGGASVYKQTISIADKLYITEVHSSFEGDTFFPPIDNEKWKEVSRKKNKKDDKNKYDYSFVVYKRKE